MLKRTTPLLNELEPRGHSQFNMDERKEWCSGCGHRKLLRRLGSSSDQADIASLTRTKEKSKTRYSGIEDYET